MLAIFKTIGFAIGAIFKAILIALLILVIAPVAYFGWHLTQPMDLPQFKGLSYIQYMQWKQITMDSQEVKYIQSHPHADGTLLNGNKITRGGCFGVDLWIDFLGRIPFSGISILADNFSHGWSLERVTQFPQEWWKTFEAWVWGEALTDQRNFPGVEYCNIKISSIPTPAQFDAMKQAAQQASVVK